MAIVLQEYNNTSTVKPELVSWSRVAWLRSNTVKVRAEGQHQGRMEEGRSYVVKSHVTEGLTLPHRSIPSLRRFSFVLTCCLAWILFLGRQEAQSRTLMER